ncbi:glutaconate CoA-transferase subunit A [Stella humosa]|uniref:Glutaconate CoA-transferase subunit A n=1 Tax=Stella humosa TaxID=94 RepID=A0A3N1ME10_9PROT|nr:CoA-transferase [Stella humosa]ROQ01519.1 glutaconate CoA-transferase subunit A [Stella humosa]BBK31898.1 CoA synthetase [Stella humosa]
MASTQFIDLADLADRIPDGAFVALPPDYSNVPMALTHALLRRPVRDLRLLCVPTSGIQADLLIGAGAVASIECAAVSLGEQGPAPRFTAAVVADRLTVIDSTCPAIHAALQASEKGLPFMPLRGILGSDILQHRPDWKVMDNPFAEGPDPIVLLPALQPDLAIFHARWADRQGNVWLGRRRELMTMAHAARRSFVTVEAFFDGDLLAEDELAAGTLPGIYVDAVALAPRGAWPMGLADLYAPDTAHLAGYARQARTEDGFRAYMAANHLEPSLVG